MVASTSFLPKNQHYCVCDECITATDKQIKGYPICDECMGFEIYYEHGGITTTPVDSKNMFEFCEKDITDIIDIKFDYLDHDRCMSGIISNGKNSWKVDFSGKGMRKGSSDKARVVDIDIVGCRYPAKRYDFGQDSMSVFILKNQAYFNVSDGHGPRGEHISYESHKYVIEVLTKNFELIQKLIITNNTVELQKLVTLWFTEIDEVFMNSDNINYSSGGTTFTSIQKIAADDGNLYTICYNLGDSPCVSIKVNDEKVVIKEITEDQNCDSEYWYERYCNWCLKKGVEPQDIYLNRFNYKQASGVYQKIPWVNHGLLPILPFKKEFKGGKYVVTENYDTMKQFYEMAPEEYKKYVYEGGSQSERAKEENLKRLAKGEYPMMNFGSTLEGKVQNLAGFGDKSTKITHCLMTEPYMSVNKYTGKGFEFVGSDGTFDPLTDKIISDIFRENSNNSIDFIVDVLFDKINECAKKAHYPFLSSVYGGRVRKLGCWDDVSYWVVKTEQIKKEKSNIDDAMWLTGC